MFYEESWIDGVLHYRTNPRGEWLRVEDMQNWVEDKFAGFRAVIDAQSEALRALRDAPVGERGEFEVHAGGEYFASVEGPRERAWREAMHYVASLSPEDGEPEVFEITRKKIVVGEEG